MEIQNVLKIGQLLKKGAEAEIYEGIYLDFDVIIKKRILKRYRHEIIDHKIRTQRVSAEAKALASARNAGINVPYLLAIDLKNYSLIIQKILGRTLAQQLVLEQDFENSLKFLESVGAETGKLHQVGIIHGDLSPYNVLLQYGRVFLIDFGLSEFSISIEKKATDLHTFSQTLEGLDVLSHQRLFESFTEGYGNSAKDVEDVLKQMEKISTRGRYVARKDRKID